MNILSIIIPCYNVEKYVGVTIDSLRKQPRQDVEFLFINDGSTDGTKTIVEQFANTDSRVKLINQENKGVSAARNTAIAAATGKYIYLLDGDDFLTDDAVESITGYVEHSDCDMLLSHIWVVRGEEKNLLQCQIEAGTYTPHDLYRACMIFPLAPQNVYKKSIIDEQCIRFNEKIKCGEVYEFTVHFLSYANKVEVVDNSFAHYVMRADSATHKINHEANRSVMTMMEMLSQHEEKFKDCLSFHLTAFKLAMTFTYNKYVLYGSYSPEIAETIQLVCNNKAIRKFTKKTAINIHTPWRERMRAWYILLFGEFGFRIAIKIRNKLITRNHLIIEPRKDSKKKTY